MTGYCWATQLGPFWNFQTFQLVLDLNIGKLPWDRRQTKRCGKPLEKPVRNMIYIHLWWVFHICVSWPEGIDTTKATMWIGKHLQKTCELQGTRLQTMSTHVGRQVASFNLTQKQYPSSAGWWILSSCTVFFILTWEEQEYKLHQTTYKYQLFSSGILGVLLLGLVLQPSQAATGICFAVKLVHCASASCKR